MTAFIIVDKMLGLDRFQIPSDKTAYARYGKSVIEIPVLLQQYLLDTLRNNVNANFSVKEEIQWVSTAVYCSFFSIKRKLVELNLMSFDASLEDTDLYYQLFTLVEEAVMVVDYSPLYAYLKGKDNICWTKLCGQIQKQIMEYALPKIIEVLKLKPLEQSHVTT